MNHFPTPYPDELLYSALARYHVRSGNMSPKMTLYELFGTNTITAVVDMPSDIDSLVCRLPKHKRLTADELIMNNTLFPYYTAFIPEIRTSAIAACMKGNGGGKIHTMAGIMASKIAVPKYLRFCPECSAEDKIKYGEYYWHRLHQMPGVILCPFHNMVIQDSLINLDMQNRHEFIAASEEKCVGDPLQINCTEADKYGYLLLSKDINWSVNNYRMVRSFLKENVEVRDCYISGLKNKGYAATNGRVYQKDLLHDFINHYGDNFLNSVQCELSLNIEDNWLSGIVRKHRIAFHTLMHLLLIRFLYGSAEEFLKSYEKFKPFRTGPWPCLNAAAEHYRGLVINEVEITHCCDTKRPVGTFECSCGFIYSRRGPDTSKDDLFKIGRIKSFGPVWEAKLAELIKNGGKSIRQIARELNIDSKTVKVYALKLGLRADEITDDIDENENDDGKIVDNCKIDINSNLLQYHRNAWLEAQKSYIEKSKTELRDIAKSHYIWLYRHDRQWLDINSPEHQKLQCINDRIDWVKRDSEVLQEVKKAVEEIRNSKDKPVRISLGRIGMICSLQGLLDKHLDKMLQTKSYIESVVETDEDYRKRRIHWAINNLDVSGEEIKAWKVMRLAGIRKEYEKQVEECLEEYLRD